MEKTKSQERLANLRSLFSSKMVGHAYLFLGPGGKQKEEAVKELAEALLCSREEGQRPCHLCRSCRLFEAGNHPDFHQIIIDGGYIKVDQIREIRREVFYLPYLSERKIYFFPDLTRLTEVAANSFLMTLEEPPAPVVFMALAPSEAGILPTILSRMQRINLSFWEEAGAQREGELKEAGEFLEGLSACHDLPAYLLLAEEWEKKGRLTVDNSLSALLSRLRAEMLAEPENRANICLLEATRRAREYLEANVNLRLLLEDLFLTIYEVKKL